LSVVRIGAGVIGRDGIPSVSGSEKPSALAVAIPIILIFPTALWQMETLGLGSDQRQVQVAQDS
jgi:hypothetical protein